MIIDLDSHLREIYFMDEVYKAQFMSSMLKRESSRTDVDPPIKRLKGARI